MKSFAILRTNVGLTTNIKIIVDSNYKLSLDSIESHPKLADTKYKNVKFIKSNYFDELVPYFFNGLPSDIAYSIKYNEDVDKMTDNFSNQYDEIYSYGARNINNNKNYTEEFEYFAPLHISLNSIPKKFIIFRVDGAGFENSIQLNRNNFKKQIIKNLKTVKLFDLTKSSVLGEWLELNFTNNKFFPNTPLEIDFRPLEFCRWNGIDYKTGGYASKSLFLDEYFADEKEIFESEKFIFEKWREAGVVYPNILNFSFLFDDTPSTPDVERKWSINRYFGFYLDDMIQTQTVSPYITPFLMSDAEVLQGNILYSPTGGDDGYPFIEKFDLAKQFWVEWKGNYYKVEKFTETLPPTLTPVTSNNITTQVNISGTKTRWRIISDTDLQGKQTELNQNFGYIDENSYLKNFNNDALVVSNYSQADVWLIEIDGKFHNITEETVGTQSFYKVNSDFTFTYSLNEFTYKVAGNTTKVSTIVDSNNPPKKWNIWKLNFTDIKDFDTRFIDTEYSKYEYEKEKELTETDESKMYMTNLNSTSHPEPFDDFIWQGKVKNIPVSSEYTANHETFKIENDDISPIWRKNPVYCRWSFQNSISGNDAPYILNNSEIFEDWNRTTNTSDPDPKRIERNLDYFYTINSSTSSYLHHSLHIEKNDDSGNIDTTFKFELDKYLNLATYSTGTGSATYSFDYFSHFFETKNHFLNGNVAKNIRKFSLFNSGDQYTPNITLFRGLKFYMYDVDSIKKANNGDINSINLKNSNRFDGWKFSILLSDNDHSVNNTGELVDSNNGMQWQIISEWQMDKKYLPGEIVLNGDILYTLTGPETITEQPSSLNLVTSKYVKSEPSNQTGWSYVANPNSIFWSPIKVYTSPSNNIYDYVVWNNNTYWEYNTSGTVDFWNPTVANNPGYNINDVVLYRSQYYKSMTSSNSFAPDYTTGFNFNPSKTNWTNYWEVTSTTQSRWSEVTIWNPSLSYPSSTTIAHNLVIWKSSANVIAGNEPGVSTTWDRQYSIEPDTEIIYTPSNNPIIKMNNRYYLSTSNTTSSTLDNGIIIYVNKKWKNILVNINIADNTIPQISETDRDVMYTDLNKKLSAYNFTTCINDIKGKYGFTDYVSYVVIEEDGKISKYNYLNKIENLQVLMNCEGPENISIKSESLIKRPIQKPKEIKSQRELVDGTINSIDEINYYNSSFVSVEIKENKSQPLEFENYHGNKNILATNMYRFSGWYMPLFYTIQLFEKGDQFSTVGNWIFDTNLTEFGLMKERVVSKVNRKGSKLRLKDNISFNSIYPMMDEIGYSVVDFFIFASTWQYGYHFESDLNPPILFTINDSINLNAEVLQIPGKSPITIIDTDNIGLPRSFQNTNLNGLL
jgi:hypothetical protein